MISSIVLLVLVIATNIQIQAFQPHHPRHLQFGNKKATTATPPTGATLSSSRVAIATTTLRKAAEGDDDEKKSPAPLSFLIGGLDTVPTARPKIVAGAGDYDKAAVRSMVEGWIKDETVLVLSSSTCPYCETVKELLRAKGVAFRAEEIDGRQDVRAEMAEIIGQTSVPAVFVDGEFIGGCNDGGRGGILPLQGSGELDKLLSDAGALP